MSFPALPKCFIWTNRPQLTVVFLDCSQQKLLGECRLRGADETQLTILHFAKFQRGGDQREALEVSKLLCIDGHLLSFKNSERSHLLRERGFAVCLPSLGDAFCACLLSQAGEEMKLDGRRRSMINCCYRKTPRTLFKNITLNMTQRY